MAKTNFTVVRNAGYTRAGFSVRERHNERKNKVYGNGDICPEREHLNVHYRQNFRPDGTPETYCETYDRLLADGAISEKWAKPNQKVFDELVFGVNTDYFERNGGYDFAVKFYRAAYDLAVKEVGGEEYILSAVLHADEKNVALSAELGRDVYHYHLHVVYVPVVEKREYFRRKKGEPENAERKLKAVYQQVSHSKKWPMRVQVERDGKTIMLNSYSLLQDRYFEGMRAAGFDGFERGERGSTAEHLDVLSYKIQQDEKRIDVLDERIEKRESKIEKLDAKLEVKQTKAATIDEINAMGKPSIIGGVHMTDDETKRLKALARKSVGIDRHANEYRRKIAGLEDNIRDLNGQIRDWRQSYGNVARDRDSYRQNYDRLWAEVKPYIEAIRKFPQQLLAFVRTLFPQKNHNKEVTR
jgi:prefoldin subunit 5